MNKIVKNFLRGFSFYRFVIPHQYKLKEKNAESMKIDEEADQI
jgi:hypothetical protein